LMSDTSVKKKMQPLHPGEVLLEEFLEPVSLSQNRLALDIGVPPRSGSPFAFPVTPEKIQRC